jgi:hypothetical protein
VEILRGLLGPKRGLAVADRWIMGILAEDVQKSLGPGELSVLRWAAFELINHPNIPTTVIINEANQVAKMFCPQQSSLIHAAVNRMIETQSSIGAELSSGGVPFIPLPSSDSSKENSSSGLLSKFPPLDPQAQLALLLMEQEALRRKRKPRGDESPESDSDHSQHAESSSHRYDRHDEDEDDLKRVRTREQRQQMLRGSVRMPGGRLLKSRIVEPLSKDQHTQTVASPQNDPHVVIVNLRRKVSSRSTSHSRD